MKQGLFTFINENEYRVIQRSGLGYKEVLLLTRDPNAADESFMKDAYNHIGSYVKVVDSRTLGDVFEYHIDYFYQGHQVYRMGEQGNIITLALDLDDAHRQFAFDLGFEMLDRGVYIKEVDKSEVEMVQVGPTPYYSF